MKTLKNSVVTLVMSILTCANVNAQMIVTYDKTIDNNPFSVSIAFAPTLDSTSFYLQRVYFSGKDVDEKASLVLTYSAKEFVISRFLQPKGSSYDADLDMGTLVFSLDEVQEVFTKGCDLKIYEVICQLESGEEVDITSEVKDLMATIE